MTSHKNKNTHSSKNTTVLPQNVRTTQCILVHTEVAWAPVHKPVGSGTLSVAVAGMTAEQTAVVFAAAVAAGAEVHVPGTVGV